jgi:16S rRNA (guanine(966)-N(2))-methyltransferase RsmD
MAGLRVIGGSAKGRKLRMVPGSGTRPIGDRVKEALFNILGADVVGARFLDLFAGTGSVGIEALSRGAAAALFVDASLRAIQTVEGNLLTTGLRDRAQVVRGDAFAFLRSHRSEPFDYVYVAPPQFQELWSRALTAIDTHPGVLNPDAWVIVQIHPREQTPIELTHLAGIEQRRYGNTLLCFFEFPGE